ncbi:MAG: hypothetical protein COU67_00440 [Candidatus Pacebacteria bacterium CG10_big_fil_rev_8_21_14_0_10_44_54]|nr:MAG: hypothetical protein COU67_00440 [Candidatus Pacebacteria bacterium CG10_big_fil_rev_8_21_14_0_10_44_54]
MEVRRVGQAAELPPRTEQEFVLTHSSNSGILGAVLLLSNFCASILQLYQFCTLRAFSKLGILYDNKNPE